MKFSGSITAGDTTDMGKPSMSTDRQVLGKKRMFAKTGAGKLNKSGATTKSESLARLRGKGALA